MIYSGYKRMTGIVFPVAISRCFVTGVCMAPGANREQGVRRRCRDFLMPLLC